MNLVDQLRAAVEEAKSPRVDWVHPSWRDVVIEHLMQHPADRRRFLSRCGVDGLALALSVSGGRAGERRLPLLQRPDDWTTTRLRAVQLVPAIGNPERRRLLAALRDLSATVSEQPLRDEVARMQREVLQTLVAAWNAEATPIPRDSLALFYLVSLETRPLVAGPHLDATWEALAAHLDNEEEFADHALEFLVLAKRNEPRFLKQIGWPSRFLASVAATMKALAEFASLAEESVKRLEIQSADDEFLIDPEELSGETYRLARVSDFLAALDVEGAVGLATRIRAAENHVDSWLERRSDEAAEREELVRDAEEDDEPESPAFDIQAVFRDL